MHKPITPPEYKIDDATLPAIKAHKNTSKNRIIYIDLLKGLAIIGVVFVHAPGHPDWWVPNNVNLIFFFLSGIFFKQEPIKELVKRRWDMIFVPFLFFYLLSYPFRLMVGYWDNRDLGLLRWDMILDVFKVTPAGDYLSVNVALWFLPCLFLTGIIYLCISHLPKQAQILLFLFIMLFSDEICNKFPTPLFINNAIYYTIFFGVGSLLGKKIIRYCEHLNERLIVLFTSIIAMIAFHLLTNLELHHRLVEIFDSLYWLAYCVAALAIFSFLNECKKLSWL